MESATSLDVLADGLQGFGHPIRIRALVLMESEQTPKDLAAVMGDHLGLVAYHVRMLRDYGLVEETRTEPRRGALAHYYRRTRLAERLLAQLGGSLKLPPRQPSKPGRKSEAEREARQAELVKWASAAAKTNGRPRTNGATTA